MPTETRPYEWLITIKPQAGDTGPRTRTIIAAYTTSDDDKPGWTLLKDQHHKVVYQVRDSEAIDVERGKLTDVA